MPERKLFDKPKKKENSKGGLFAGLAVGSAALGAAARGAGRTVARENRGNQYENNYPSSLESKTEHGSLSSNPFSLNSSSASAGGGFDDSTSRIKGMLTKVNGNVATSQEYSGAASGSLGGLNLTSGGDGSAAADGVSDAADLIADSDLGGSPGGNDNDGADIGDDDDGLISSAAKFVAGIF